MDLKDELVARWRGADINIRFFAHTYAVAHAVNSGGLAVGIEGKIVETTICESIAIV